MIKRNHFNRLCCPHNPKRRWYPSSGLVPNPLSKRCKEWLFSEQVIESTSISGLLNQRIEDEANCFLDLGFIHKLSNSNASDLNVKTAHLVVTVSFTIFAAFESLPNIDQKISPKDILLLIEWREALLQTVP